MIMENERSVPPIPTAVEMASCLREPGRLPLLRERIRAHFEALRRGVERPPGGDARLIRSYGDVMGRLREDEDATRMMLEAFARGDAESVRDACESLARR